MTLSLFVYLSSGVQGEVNSEYVGWLIWGM